MTTGHLLHEGTRLQPQPQHGDAQHGVLRQNDVILAQGILYWVERPGVVPAIDLDDQTDVLPCNIEVDPPISAPAHHLSARKGETVATTQGGEVEFTQRLGTIADVRDDCVKEGPPSASAEGLPHRQQAIRMHQPLLDRHAQHEGCLAIGSSPVRRADHRMFRSRPWQACLEDRSQIATKVQPHSEQLMALVPMGQSDIDARRLKTLEPSCAERTGTIQHGTRTRLPDGPPQASPALHGTGPDDHRVPPGSRPSTRRDLGADISTRHPEVAQVSPMSNAVVDRGQRGSTRCPLLAGQA